MIHLADFGVYERRHQNGNDGRKDHGLVELENGEVILGARQGMSLT